MADLEYIRVSFFASYEMLMENLLDPAHVPFAHHKYQGDRNKARPCRPWCSSVLRFPFFVTLPPFHVSAIEEGSGKKQRTAILFFHCIPRLPGQSRLIWLFMNNIIPPWVPMPPEWFLPTITWLSPHIPPPPLISSRSSPPIILFSLSKPLLSAQSCAGRGERRLEEEGGAEGVKSYHTPASADSFERWLEEEGGAVQGIKSYYTPTSADSFVSAYRSWLVRFAGGKARFPAYVNPELPAAKSRREILDRQRFHVRLCPDCQRVQRWSDHLRTALWAASLLLLATTTLFPLPPFIPLPSFLPLPHWHVPEHRGAVIVFLLFTFFPSFPTSSPPFSPPPPPHRQRFHVRLCPDCQRVQRWSDRLRTALWAASLLLLAATALLPIAPPAIRQAAGPMGAVFAAAAAVVCAAAAHWLKGFMERNYVYEDFVHALWYPAKK
ncbi:unnamed protein product [Closterium sp. NIES-64]|nr:unnamed protein product [Closterium sp. NIES-64]